jgi:hypothetical protein
MKPLTFILSPERLCRNYYFITLNLFQGLVTNGFYEMLKSEILNQVQDLVQHDIFLCFPLYDTVSDGGEGRVRGEVQGKRKG